MEREEVLVYVERHLKRTKTVPCILQCVKDVSVSVRKCNFAKSCLQCWKMYLPNRDITLTRNGCIFLSIEKGERNENPNSM